MEDETESVEVEHNFDVGLGIVVCVILICFSFGPTCQLVCEHDLASEKERIERSEGGCNGQQDN